MSYFNQYDAIRTMMRRVTVVSVDDSDTQQIVTYNGLAGERNHKAYRQQAHGASSVPPKGSEGWIVALGGRSDRPLFLDGEHKDHRPKNTPAGGKVIYDDKGNQSRYLGDDGIWHVAGDRPQKMDGKTIHLTGKEKVNLKVGGITLIVSNGRVDIGGEGGSAVMTESGPSSVVFAKV